jgi:hypothetical protein
MVSAGSGRVLVSDAVVTSPSPASEVCSTAALLSDAIGRLHRNKRLDSLLMRC